MTRISNIILILLVTLVSASAPAEEIVKIAAGAAPIENVLKPVKEAFEKKFGVKLEIMKGTPRTTLEMLDQGRAEMAIVAFEFNEWMNTSEKMGYQPPKDQYLRRVIGNDVLNLVVHPSVTATRISHLQLKEILTGKAESWSRFKFGPEKVQVVLSTEMPGLNSLIEEKLLDGAKILAHHKLPAQDVKDLRKKIGETPGAIGWIPNGATKNQSEVRVIETDQILGRPMTVITKGRPSPRAEALFKFISESSPQK